MGEAAGLENDGAQLGNAAAAPVVEMNKRKARAGHGILQEREAISVAEPAVGHRVRPQRIPR
jgi:hypothetical protein